MASYFNVLDYIIGSVLKLLLHMDFQIYLAMLDLNFKHIPGAEPRRPAPMPPPGQNRTENGIACSEPAAGAAGTWQGCRAFPQ